jgi:predicted XRE-type DNA-binding protein
MGTAVRRSSGNVFQDLESAPQEAANLQARADLMIQLTGLLAARRLTQAAAAKLLGVTRPRVSVLMRGKIDRFSLDNLVELLSRAGRRVTFVVKPVRKVA